MALINIYIKKQVEFFIPDSNLRYSKVKITLHCMYKQLNQFQILQDASFTCLCMTTPWLMYAHILLWFHPVIPGIRQMCYVIVTARSLLWTLLTVVATMAVLSAVLTPKWLIGPPRLKPSGTLIIILQWESYMTKCWCYFIM